MVDISAFASALTSFKTAKDIAESMIGLRDAQAFQAKLLEFQSKLIDANNAVFAAHDERAALLERIRKLEEEMTRLKAWDAEKQRYQLTEIGPGVVAFVLKEGISQGEPPHQICANCCANGKKSYLQRHLSGPSLDRLKCNTCAEAIDINRPRPPGAAPPTLPLSSRTKRRI